MELVEQDSNLVVVAEVDMEVEEMAEYGEVGVEEVIMEERAELTEVEVLEEVIMEAMAELTEVVVGQVLDLVGKELTEAMAEILA